MNVAAKAAVDHGAGAAAYAASKAAAVAMMDSLAGRFEGLGREGELDSSEHHRYCGEPSRRCRRRILRCGRSLRRLRR